MPEPNREKWIEISELFYKKTNFPNCLGSIDGKHMRCRNPNNSGSLFYNYKKYFSIVLMAVVDANLNFIFIDVGAYGREADSNVFRNSVFGKKLYRNQLQIPDPVSLPLTENNLQPFVFVADEAFELHTNLLRPYPGRKLNNTCRIFNYRLSRARRTVECAFGVLANKKRDGCNYDEDVVDTTYINNLDDFQGHGRLINRNGMEIRDNFANYFINEGAVPFQYRTTL
ncbi:hypothetical protein AGLY_003120 [Aphis glycines]|uniref:DDE Tnp4 domain-containing protein n=1 Tax=Aphis glycines TaxID=307491 RepID=A0A6G0U3K7_APHGL|nr:hypothetical protein AGLY_003120 [Aphis glycines]